jgi:hypothetical protein
LLTDPSPFASSFLKSSSARDSSDAEPSDSPFARELIVAVSRDAFVAAGDD